MRTKKNIIIASLCLFVATFISGHFIGLSDVFTHIEVGRDTEIRVNDISEIIIDKQERIFCSLRSKDRIQVYNIDGGFLFGFNVDAGAGMFKLHLNDDNSLKIVTARGNNILKYSSEGQLLSKEKYDQHINKPSFYPRLTSFRLNKDLYEIKLYDSDSLCGFDSLYGSDTHIIKTDEQGIRTTVIKPLSLSLKYLVARMICIVSVTINMILLLILKKWNAIVKCNNS